MHALEHVRDEARAAGDDVRVDFEPAARHADRIVDALLSVDREVARKRVNDLAVARQVDDLAGVDHPPDVAVRDLAVVAGDGDDGTVVGAANVIAGDADEDVGDVNAGHPLGLLGRRLDRLDRLLEVDDDALAHPQRRRLADADDLEAVCGPSAATTAQVLVVPISSPQTVSCFIRCVTCPALPSKKFSTTTYCGRIHAIPTTDWFSRARWAGVGEPAPNSLGTNVRTACA